MHFRPATIEDANNISALISLFAREFMVEQNGEGAEPFLASISAEAEARYIASERYQFLLAELDGALAGFIAMRDGTHLFHLFVVPNQQGKGLATRLWQLARSVALAQDLAANWTVNASLNAIPVYERFGFLRKGDVMTTHGIAFQPMIFTTDMPISRKDQNPENFTPAIR